MLELKKEIIEWNNKQDVNMFCSIMSILGNKFKNNKQKNKDKEFDLFLKNKYVKKHLPSEFEIERFVKPMFNECYNHLYNKNQKNKEYYINYLVKIIKNRNELSVDIVWVKKVLENYFCIEQFDFLKDMFVITKDITDLELSLKKYYNI